MLDIDTSDRLPNKDRLGELADQVERLRRSNGRLLIVAVLGPVLAVVVAIGWMSSRSTLVESQPQAKPNVEGVLEVRGLVIRDEMGVVRATLGYEDKIAASLKLYDAGSIVTEYHVPARGMGLLTFNHPGELAALQLGGGAGGDSGLDMYDTKGFNQLSLTAHRDGGELFTMSRAKEHQRFQLGVHGHNGIAFFDFFDDRGKDTPMLDKAGMPIRK